MDMIKVAVNIPEAYQGRGDAIAAMIVRALRDTRLPLTMTIEGAQTDCTELIERINAEVREGRE